MQLILIVFTWLPVPTPTVGIPIMEPSFALQTGVIHFKFHPSPLSSVAICPDVAWVNVWLLIPIITVSFTWAPQVAMDYGRVPTMVLTGQRLQVFQLAELMLK